MTTVVGNGTTTPYTTVTLPAAGITCSNTALSGCDPRGIGLNPIVNSIWTKFLPLPNDPLAGDGFNTQGFLGVLKAPLKSDVYIGRIDHDFGSKHHFFTTWHGQKLVNNTTNQVDVGGLLGGSFGAYTPTAPRPASTSRFRAANRSRAVVTVDLT